MARDVVVTYLHPNQIGHNFHHSLMRLQSWDYGHEQRIGEWLMMRSGSGGIVQARNRVMHDYLEMDNQFEWLMWMDADMGFEPDALDRLLAVADPQSAPVVGGLCFAWKELAVDEMGGFRCVARPTMFDWVEHEDGVKRFTGLAVYPKDQLVQVAGTGAAFILSHRSVIEQIAADADTRGWWFDRIRGTDGELLGEDISYCVRVASYGHPLYVHTGIQTNHLKELWVSEQVFDDQQELASFRLGGGE